MNSGLTSHQQRGHTETVPRFKVSSERSEKRGIDLAIDSPLLRSFGLKSHPKDRRSGGSILRSIPRFSDLSDETLNSSPCKPHIGGGGEQINDKTTDDPAGHTKTTNRIFWSTLRRLFPWALFKTTIMSTSTNVEYN